MKVAESYKMLQKYLEKNKIEAYRLFRDQNVAVDIYREAAVIHVFGKAPKNLEEEIFKTHPVKAFFYKDRTAKSAGGRENSTEEKKSEIIVNEYGHKFLINLSDYLDVGLFLDHRETRRFIASKCKGKTVLNTFAYTGSFSIYAAAAGATKTYSVDLSKTYCEWIKKNLTLNNLPEEKNWVYKMDTSEFFRYAARKKLSFDIIIIDPPTFSKNKGENFSVERDHPEFLNAALELLTPDGFILFSNNCKSFRMDERKITPCRIRETREFIPPDFEGVFSHNCYILSH